jgi:hypothetical protein
MDYPVLVNSGKPSYRMIPPETPAYSDAKGLIQPGCTGPWE